MHRRGNLRHVSSFGAGVVINWEYNEFLHEQKEKRLYRKTLAFLVVFVPACIVFAWGISHLVLGLDGRRNAERLNDVVNKNLQIASIAIKLNLEAGTVVYSLLHNVSNDTILHDAYNATDRSIEKFPYIWENAAFPLKQRFNYTKQEQFQELLKNHRSNLTAKNVSVGYILDAWEWYRDLINDFYTEVNHLTQMDEDLPLWPHFLENDYAFMFHRLLNTKRFYGSLFLYYGNSSLLEHKRPLWFELVGAISEQTLLHVSASYMALNFRKFVSGKQKDYTDNLDLDRIDQTDDRMQNMYVDSGSLSSGNAAEARWYSEETGKYMAETELFFEADALRTKEELAREEAEAYARCTWAGISIMVALAGGLLNMFAIRSFVAHFVREVKITATEHKNKTLDLRVERRKTNMVLHSMLPKKIADELKFRKVVRPTYHESVSLYFSDVQGFTALSSRSTPEEIVVMLTELYTGFDDILDNYKVWKLETIGDAYCIIAGASNQDDFDSPMEHAKEMVDCSLSIRDYIRHFPIPHFPDEVMQIRIGVHTGGVVAGVAGVGMHRYCVVGDALSIVELVEAAGKHGRVHITEDTRNALFPKVSEETIYSTENDQEDVHLENHPNYKLYTLVANPEEEVVLDGKIIKTFWIDRKRPPPSRYVRSSFKKESRIVLGGPDTSASDKNDQSNTLKPSALTQPLQTESQLSLSPTGHPESNTLKPVASAASELSAAHSALRVFSSGNLPVITESTDSVVNQNESADPKQK